MKVKIIEYKIHKGNKVRVQSHNKIHGKWKVNPNFELHEQIYNGRTMMMYGTVWKKEYDKELQ